MSTLTRSLCLSFHSCNPPTQTPIPQRQRSSTTGTLQPWGPGAAQTPLRPQTQEAGFKPLLSHAPGFSARQALDPAELGILRSQSCSTEGSRALRSSRHFPQDPGFWAPGLLPSQTQKSYTPFPQDPGIRGALLFSLRDPNSTWLPDNLTRTSRR